MTLKLLILQGTFYPSTTFWAILHSGFVSIFELLLFHGTFLFCIIYITPRISPGAELFLSRDKVKPISPSTITNVNQLHQQDWITSWFYFPFSKNNITGVTVRSSISKHLFSTIVAKIYLSLLFPEVFKTWVIVLHAFDSHSNLVVLVNILVLSIQYCAVQSILVAEHPKKTSATRNGTESDGLSAYWDYYWYAALLCYLLMATMVRLFFKFWIYNDKGFMLALGGLT